MKYPYTIWWILMNIPCLKVHLVRWATDFWLNFYTREGTPMFEMFDPIGSLFYAPTWSDCPPLSAGKVSLSLSHLVPEILGPKFGLMFHQMYYLTLFKHFVSSFSLIFYPFFFFDFRSFLPLIFTKPYIRLGHIFYLVLYLATENLVKYPHPWGLLLTDNNIFA